MSDKTMILTEAEVRGIRECIAIDGHTVGLALCNTVDALRKERDALKATVEAMRSRVAELERDADRACVFCMTEVARLNKTIEEMAVKLGKERTDNARLTQERDEARHVIHTAHEQAHRGLCGSATMTLRAYIKDCVYGTTPVAEEKHDKE